MRSCTATLIKSSQRLCVGGRRLNHRQILAASVSCWTNLRIWSAIGLRTGITPSTKPEPYFHPRPLREPPFQGLIADCELQLLVSRYRLQKLVTSFPGQLFRIECSPLPALVEKNTVLMILSVDIDIEIPATLFQSILKTGKFGRRFRDRITQSCLTHQSMKYMYMWEP